MKAPREATASKCAFFLTWRVFKCSLISRSVVECENGETRAAEAQTPRARATRLTPPSGSRGLARASRRASIALLATPALNTPRLVARRLLRSVERGVD